jgi:hypothetical protein
VRETWTREPVTTLDAPICPTTSGHVAKNLALGPDLIASEAANPMAVALGSLVAVELDWSVLPAVEEIYAQSGVMNRSAEVAAHIEGVIRSRVGAGLVAELRGENSVTLLFATSGGWAGDISLKHAARDERGMDIPGTSVRIAVRATGVVDVSGEGWSLDFLTTKRGALASLAPYTFADAREAFESWLNGGGVVSAESAKRGRKSAQRPERARRAVV